ncbi:MAG: permease-like cell division protein FtsX [Ruminiclostridium sp.]|nr:permease-like cell division protein FtsX [Ruminiclostridium sp.]MBQ9933140.1 permease-like cell division protein FtsX [Ruminiclostridium sp.]
MFSNQIGYHIKEGFRSIFTHGLMSFASVCMIVACLLIMGSFSLVAVNINEMLGQLEDENEFLAYVDESLDSGQSMNLQAKLASIPNVASATYISKEEALQQFKAEQGNDVLFQDIPADTLRDRYSIHVEDIELMEQTVAEVEAVTGIAETRAALEIAEGFVMLRNVASAIAIILIVMLVLISVFIIANTIKLATFSRREEIAIMKMCGATNWFIRWPFLVEGLLLGLMGGLVAYVCQWGVYSLIGNAMAQSGILEIITMIPFHDLAGVVLPVFVAVSLVIGGGGSAFAIRKFLQV